MAGNETANSAGGVALTTEEKWVTFFVIVIFLLFLGMMLGVNLL